MTDISKRLREEAEGWVGATHTVTGPRLAKLLNEAADEIERLREGRDTMGNLWAKEKAENERLRGENERLRGHIYASNRPQPEEVERLRKLLDACRGAMRVTQRVHPNATDWRGMIAAIDSAIGSKETSRRANAE